MVECLQTLVGHSDAVTSVAFSHNSAQVASASWDRTVKVWDASSGECLQTLIGHISEVTSVAFSHDSSQVASASDDKTVKVWDASSGECFQTLEVRQSLHELSFDSNSYYLHTEIGAIYIGDSTAPNWTTAIVEPQPQHQGIALSLDNTFITHNR